MKYRDTRSLGPSEAVPFVPGEDAADRHVRRAREAVDQAKPAMVAFARFGVTLTIMNFGGHWIMTHGSRRAEWWPSSAKLVVNQKWQRGIHAHDWTQVLNYLRKVWKLRGPTP